MKKNRLLSIIIVSFNDSIRFEKTIKSLLNQNITKREIILIDGGSNVENYKILKKYKKHLDVFISEPDKGIYNAMNKGINMSSGDSFLFLNCGDYVINQVLDDNFISPSLLPLKYTNSFGIKKFQKKGKLFLGTPYCHQGIIFSKNNLKYNENYIICSDYEYIIKFFKHKQSLFKKCNIIKSSGYILYDDKGISSVNIKKRDKEALEIVYKNFNIILFILFKIKILTRNILVKIYAKFN